MSSQQPRKVRRTIFIGLGGTGNEVVRRVKREMLRHRYDLPIFQYLVLDTVIFDEKPGLEPLMRLRNGEEYLYIGGYNPNEVLKNLANWPVIGRWWGNRKQTNLVTVDEGAGQMRSVGRMGFFYHFNTIEVQLRRIVQEVTSVTNRENALVQNYDVSANDPIIYIVFSLCGGTGSSLFFDVAYVLKQMLASAGMKPTIVGMAMLPGPFIQSISSIPQQERIQANTYAALMEMERLHNMALGLEEKPDGKNMWSVQYATNFRVDSPELPFEYIYLIDDTTVKGEKQSRLRIYNILGRAIFWLSGPSTAAHFWERAKNLNSKTVAGGGLPDSSGRLRLSPYSSLGISTVVLDWQLERVQHELENLLIVQIGATAPIKPTLPSWLNSENALVEEVSGEPTGVNPLPPSKALRPIGTFKDRAAIDEMLDRFTVKYQAALNSIPRSVIWQRGKETSKLNTIALIDRHVHDALCVRGPVATLQELEVIRDRFSAILLGINELDQKAKQRKAELDDEYDRTTRTVQRTNLISQIGENIKSFLGRVYFFEAFRKKSSSRDLNVAAENAARQRYLWYQESFRIIICSEVAKSILEPVIAHLDKQKAPFNGIERALEAWKDRNMDAYRIHGSIREFIDVERIRPHLSESEQVQEAIMSRRLKLDLVMEEVLKRAFNGWPKPGEDPMNDLKPAIMDGVSETLRFIGGEEHLVDRLLGKDVEMQRKSLMQGAECLWNFTKDANQNVLSHLEAIDILSFGIDPRQGITSQQMLPSVEELLRNQSPRPDPVPTDISDELALMKTSHGLQISAIRSIHELQHSYQVMNTVRAAPYLHIDYTDQARAGYGPLGNLELTYKQLIDMWVEVADNVEQVQLKLAEGIRDALDLYKKFLISVGLPPGQLLEVSRENDPFFDFADAIRLVFKLVPKTPGVSQALMKLADIEDVLHAQGWMKIDPPYNARFDPTLYYIQGTRSEPGVTPGRVVEVTSPGYIRYQPQRQVRLAMVIVSA